MSAAARCLALIASAVLLALPASAQAGAGDGAAAQAYLGADHRLVAQTTARLARFERAPRELLASVRATCPAAAANSPQDADSTLLSDEVIGAMVISAYHPNAAAILAFVHATQSLRFSRASVQRQVREYARKLAVIVHLKAPPLCADVRAWAAGGYGAVPPDTARFDAVFMPSWVGVGEQPAGLRAFESASSRALASRTGELETLIVNAEAQAVETWGMIMNDLDLYP